MTKLENLERYIIEAYPRGKINELLDEVMEEKRQAGIDEAVEIIKGMKRNQDAPKENDPHFTGCGGCGEAYPAICGCREVNQALDDTIKALHDKK